MKFSECSPVRTKALFEPISFEVLPGTVTALMGPSGIGKSSLLDAIKGKLGFTGTISSTGEYFSVFQETDQLFPWMTVRQNLELARSTDWQNHSQQWNLADLLEKFPDTLSVGQRQRFTLLRALHSGRSNLLCDEPLSGVDWETAKDILTMFCNSVADSNKHVLWVTHNPREAQFFNQVITLNATS
jgi:ABC-type nitrate/sulfonate/bicarbonate transport system ATPase subunit